VTSGHMSFSAVDPWIPITLLGVIHITHFAVGVACALCAGGAFAKKMLRASTCPVK
jgi:hypothetical protein